MIRPLLPRIPFDPRLSAPRAKALATFYTLAMIPADRDQCWGWLGATSQKRGGHPRPMIYIGQGRAARLNITAARFILCVVTGKSLFDPAIADLEAGHRCANETCVNPAHLRWVTRSENEQDKHAPRD